MKNFQNKSFLILFISISLLMGTNGCASHKKAQKSKTQSAETTKAEKKPAKASEFFKNKQEQKQGLFTVYKSDNRFYLEIPDSLLNKDLLMVSRLSQGSAGVHQGTSGFAGDHINTKMIRFEKNPYNNILLRTVLTSEYTDSTEESYKMVSRSNLQAIAASFEIKVVSDSGNTNIIDITDYLNSESSIFSFPKHIKNSFNLGNLQADKSYIVGINTYPQNVELKSVKTFLTQDGETATFELNNSIIALPENPMTPRYADERVGFFSRYYTSFDENPQGVKGIQKITRWRLEPKPEDLEKYKQGELVEPQNPIVFYIDPATPEKWVPYLIQGVNDWQKAFEKAGFKNAIVGRRAPSKEEDSTWSLEDARYSAIVYKPSTTANASGPHVADPRTGEILESHINWYHNVMSLLRNWYFIQCGALDTGAQKLVFDDELMGQLIRFVSSHEVGHTLGLRHNFGSSALVPTEKLRDSNFMKTDGFAYSIMDYARFNYVAQPEDHIRRELLFPKIGIYDEWALQWGYTLFPDIDDPVAELPKLNEWVIEKSKDPRLWFGSERSSNDPRCQSEDLGDNQMIANEYGIKNMKIVVANLQDWTKTPNEGYGNLAEMYQEIVRQYNRYTVHAARWIGGIYQTPKRVEQAGNIYEFVPKEKQKEAFEYLKRNLFKEPVWLLDTAIAAKTGQNILALADNIQTAGIQALLQPRVLQNLLYTEKIKGKEAYTIQDFFEDMNKAVFSKETGAYYRNLQKSYIKSLLNLLPASSSLIVVTDNKTSLQSPSIDTTDLEAFVAFQLKTLQKQLQNMSGDTLTKAHYEYLSRLIKIKLAE